jgi:transposase
MALHLIAFIYLVLVTFYMKVQNLDQLRDSVTLEEQRAFIKINVLLDTSPRVVLAQLQTALPNTGLQQSAVYKWYGDFRDGKRTDITEQPRSGRPRTATDDENEERIRQLILESEGMRTEDLVYETQFSKSSLLRLLKEIGAKKIRSRWCPKELTARQMQARMNIAGKHLARYQRESGFLNKIIAIDETWLKSYDPRDSKAESEWLLPGQKP